MTIRFGQRTAIIIGSNEIARDMLDKRSALYSSRPRLILAFEHLSQGLTMVLIPYTEQWRLHNRVATSLLTPNLIKRYQYIQDIESKQLLHELLTCNDFSQSFLRYVTSVQFALAYGQRIERHDRDEIAEMQNILNYATDALSRFSLGAVECFPVLSRLPRFLAPWKSFGEEKHRLTIAFLLRNLKYGQSISTWNWAQESSKLTDGMPLDKLAYLIGTINEGAIETTPKILRTILKAVVLHPALAQRAQAEIDTVVGADRLPSFDDLPQLSYTNAFVNEVMRWQPTLLLSPPHSTTTDDEYMGFRIPKGSMIISNNYRMAYNSEQCPSPFEFKPERWLENPDLQTFSVFGNGRRKWPGRHFAMKNRMIVTSRILWTYDVSPDFRDGKIVKIDPWGIRHQFTSSPGPFEVSFQVRSQDRQRVVEQEWQNAEKDTHAILETVRPKQDGA